MHAYAIVCTEIPTLLIEYDIHLTLNLQTVTFGITFSIEKTNTQLKNFAILLGKYFIFINKYKNVIPALNHFKPSLRKWIKIEKEIYFMKDKLAQFERIWGKLENIIN